MRVQVLRKSDVLNALPLIISLNVQLIAPQAHLVAKQIADGADHALPTTDVRVRLQGSCLLGQSAPELADVRLHVAAAPAPSRGRLRERRFEAKVRVRGEQRAHLALVEDVFGMAGPEDKPDGGT